jgi:hypothetical protein
VLPDLAGLPDLWRSIGRGRHFRLCTVAREPRQSAVTRVEALVQAQRGDILDFKMFSNLSLNLLVELEASGLTALADALQELGWAVELAPEREALRPRGVERLEGTVQVTFPDGDGELIIPLPKVPG